MKSPLPFPAMSLPLLVALAGCAPAAKEHPPSGTNTVTAADLAEHPNEPIEVTLQRKVPGLIITRTSGGGIALRIRGRSAYNETDSPPLYVVDDVPIEPGPDGAVPGLDPFDVESIRVLKGAETSIYGIRGADGVILIKTKRGPAKK